MLLIPFFWDTRKTGWIKFGVFLCSAGREIWSMDDSSTDLQINDLLTENGFPVKKLNRTSTAVFVEIDHATLNLLDILLLNLQVRLLLFNGIIIILQIKIIK